MKNYTKKSLKASNGITLIALVITIIVLIILAGISISLVLGNNGILTRAREGRNNYQVAANEEAVVLAGGEDTIDEIATGKIKPKPKEINSIETDGDIKIKLSLSGTNINGDTPPNPDSSIFEHTEGTIATGYVIKDKNNGNEFVWVPVLKDQKLKLKVESTQEITAITLKDPLNTTIDLGITGSIGTSYENNNITPTINGQYSITVTAGSSQTAKLVVRNLYAKDAFNDYSNAKGKATANNNDPDTQEITDIKQSVNNNGGFYIGRYEAGAPTTRTRGNSSATVDSIVTANGVPVCKQDQTPYNYITQSQAKGLAEKMYEGKSFTCTLPTGAAWDRTLGWIITTEGNGLDLKKVTYNSSTWGNYKDVGFDIARGKYSTNSGSSYTEVITTYSKPESSVLLTTGAAPNRNVSNNIYDLAGNVCEWTTEVYPSNLLFRGGIYNEKGSSYPASLRIYISTNDYGANSLGFRPALYL